MSPRRTRHILILLSLLLLAASGQVLWWGFSDIARTLLDPRPIVVSSRPADLMDVGVSQDGQSLSAESFTSTWQKPLRRVLYDPPPPPKPPPPEKQPPPPVRATLMATMTEAEQSMAMLKLGGGEVVFRKAGERVSPDDETAVIADIKPGVVTVHQGEHVTELRLDGQR